MKNSSLLSHRTPTSTLSPAPWLEPTFPLSLWVIGGASLALSVACSDADVAAEKPDGPASGIAVMHSDYTSSVVSLVDLETGDLGRDDCINSGAHTPAPSLALSGDVVLPLSPQAGGGLVLIDRTNSALTWMDPVSCQPLRQLSVATGFFSNPQDIISISESKAYVTRSRPNESPTSDPSDYDEGNDVLIIDPSVPSILGRIDMGQYATSVPGYEIVAGPSRGLFVDGRVYVTLGNIAPDFDAAGFGRIVVIDPATDEVTETIDLPDLKSCRQITHEPTSHRLVLACAGLMADGDERTASSAIVAIDLDASPPSIEAILPATTIFGDRGVGLERNPVMLTESQGVIVSLGEFGAEPTDQLWLFDLQRPDEPARELASSKASFQFGDIVFDADRNHLYLGDADAAAPRLRVYSFEEETLEEISTFNGNPSRGLPPRGMARY